MKQRIYTFSFWLSCVFLTHKLQAQIISTVAGNGSAAYSGDGGQATAAKIYNPAGVAIDASGNIYIADQRNNRVRKINTSGVISTFAGNGTQGDNGSGGQATATELYYPSGVAVDGSGNVYIADKGNNRVLKVNTLGIANLFAGDTPAGFGGYSGDGMQATASALNAPSAIAIDNTGHVFIADAQNERVRIVYSNGQISTLAGGGTSGLGDGGQANLAELNDPTGVAVDDNGIVYIADALNNRIRKVDLSGVITTYAGTGTGAYSGDGGQATAAKLNTPTSVTIDGNGNLFIADQENNRIREVNTAGVITTFAGNGTASYSGDGAQATATSLYNPAGTAIDGCGNVYIADFYNNRIREVSGHPKPTLSTTLTPGEVCSATPFEYTPASASPAIFAWARPAVTGISNAAASGAGNIDETLINTTGTSIAVTYDYTLNAYSGCINIEFVTVNIDPCTAFVPVTSLSPITVTTSPNPNNGNFTLLISSAANEQATVCITNITGEKIKEFITTTNKEIPVVIDVPGGMFFLSVTTAKNKFVQKIMIAGK